MPIRVPKYRLHKPSGQALVEIQGRRIYLGKHGTEASQQKYRQQVAQLLAEPETPRVPAPAPDALTINELILGYFRFAKSYYVKNGKPTDEINALRAVLRRLRKLYGCSNASEFGPKAFKQFRDELIREELSRKYINDSMARVRRMFRWGVAEELVPPSVYQALSAVTGLRRGRSPARETAPVLPVDDAIVEATLPYLPSIVADLVRFQRLTGCRPTEACLVRPKDITRSKAVWVYRPESHKTEHHGRERLIAIGPQAQAVLEPYLDREEDRYCFSPAESHRNCRSARHAERKTPIGSGNRPGTNRKASPKRTAGERYTKDSYNRAVARACKKAGVDKWTPNQLRHSRATEIRKAFGLEASQVALGHSNANVTQIYAERDLDKAIEVAAKLG